MMKTLLTSVWVLIVALGAAFGAVEWQKRQAAHQAAEAEGKKEVKLSEFKTKPINVPIIADGIVQGYIVAQFSITIDDNQLKEFPSILRSTSSTRPSRRSMRARSSTSRSSRRRICRSSRPCSEDNVNKRLGRPMVQEVLIQQLGYIPKEDMRGDNK